ncbi:MAG: CAP domain-containing protein [Desulfitobacteriaceae bacterium]|nr:CAP domain-containing protein [Desulfitobacteriaceae bacterium]
MTAAEQQMVDLVNQERTSRGLKALTVDMRLVKLARMKSQDMIDKGYFDHNSPTYGSPFDMMKNAGITYRTAGENLAGHRTVQGAHTGLMNSPGHRANILNANFTHIGIGIVDGGRYGKMFTQHFIG